MEFSLKSKVEKLLKEKSLRSHWITALIALSLVVAI